MILFLLGAGVDPAVLGYERWSPAELARRIRKHRYRIGESELEHCTYLANMIWGLKWIQTSRKEVLKAGSCR